MQIGNQLAGIARCPHCGTANPTLERVWRSDAPIPRATPGPINMWAAYRCTSCGDVTMAKGRDNDNAHKADIIEIFPAPRAAHEDLPPVAKKFLQQALEALHAPDAAAVMAGSAVDAMLKELNYKDGSVYSRIDKAVEDNVLTAAMGEWAHSVRLGSNRPRHADANNPHVSPTEAKQSVEFAEALGQFLFVLTARINRGIESAKQVEDSNN